MRLTNSMHVLSHVHVEKHGRGLTSPDEVAPKLIPARRSYLLPTASHARIQSASNALFFCDSQIPTA